MYGRGWVVDWVATILKMTSVKGEQRVRFQVRGEQPPEEMYWDHFLEWCQRTDLVECDASASTCKIGPSKLYSDAPVFARTLQSAMPLASWPPARAHTWAAAQPWRMGSNFLPSTASNQFEMFQAETFDMPTLERELSWAAAVGTNLVRVFLHNLLWEPGDVGEAFLERVDSFLNIATRAGIGTMLVLFDGCWDPLPALGVQLEPRPHVHNSRWVQAPGATYLGNTSRLAELRPYVQAVVR